MCTYNGERFLPKQLDSLIGQNYSNLEIIVVDDCSTDKTLQILEAYACRHRFIHIYRNDANVGFLRNFEKAISLAKGTFIALCDQDDIWLPHKISTLMQAIGTCSLAYSKIRMIDSEDRETETVFPASHLLEGRCHMGLLFDNCITGHCILAKKSLLDAALPFPPGIAMHDQWLAFVAGTMDGVRFCNEVLSLYRHHGNNAVLANKTKIGKLRRRMAKYRSRLSFIEAASKVATLTPEESTLLTAVTRTYEKYPSSFRNERLRKLLVNHQDILLPLYKDRSRSAEHLSRGLLRDLF